MKKPSTKVSPLNGLRVVVGRARPQASALSSVLQQQGAEVIEIPFIEIRGPKSFAPMDKALRNLKLYDWLIFTSVNGVDAVCDRLKELQLALPTHPKIAVIGPATRKRAEDLGLRVDIVPKQYVAESVVESLRRRVKGKRILLARAKVARDIIPAELRKLGAHVDVVEAYETIVPESSRKKLNSIMRVGNRTPDVITFTSSSTVKNFVALLDDRIEISERVKFASIGPVTSRTLRESALRVDIEAAEYTIPGLVAAIIDAVARK